MKISELENLNAEFLRRWDWEKVKNMTLEQYVGIGNKDTFCQWVETETRPLGSIKGLTSIKFGIYERKKVTPPKKYRGDLSYSWLVAYDEGHDRNLAFQKTKIDILKIIDAAILGKFELIDDIPLPSLFKWKVAFLYSDERLIPIFQNDVLIKIATHYGLKANKKTKISEIQNLMIAHKPPEVSVYKFMRELFFKFAKDEDKKELVVGSRKPRTKRKAAAGRNTDPHEKKPGRKSFVVQQRHNIIQENLVAKLTEDYGKNCVVLLEENYVDVKVFHKDHIAFYEVKSAENATKCIKEALGQILLYTFNDDSPLQKKLYVVGQYAVTLNDEKYIEFIRDNLNFDFEYIAVSIS